MVNRFIIVVAIEKREQLFPVLTSSLLVEKLRRFGEDLSERLSVYQRTINQDICVGIVAMADNFLERSQMMGSNLMIAFRLLRGSFLEMNHFGKVQS